MFSVESLRQTALEAESRYKQLCEQYPAGTYHEGRNDARAEMCIARACADWMEANGHQQLANVGPFASLQPERGQRYRIRKGARVFSTHPAVPLEGVELQRTQVVTAHSVDKGWVDIHTPAERGQVTQGRVHWAGAGGYWRWTDINNIERAVPPASA